MQLIPLSQRFIAGKSERTVSARKLHEFLGVGRNFGGWITSQIDRFEFRENQDFIRVFLKTEKNSDGGKEVFSKTGKNPKGGRPDADYYLSLDMAKELAMLSGTAKGREGPGATSSTASASSRSSSASA